MNGNLTKCYIKRKAKEGSIVCFVHDIGKKPCQKKWNNKTTTV